ncbi:hypothetical protein FBY58_1300 [Zymomonas mobilis]|uniref:Uncharacterized protein n=1 Tax=Zymomonas mobilis TaxID=542 RepID=A0A542W286_ZYMMB|nr:hypothetical protein FBY58_1300 [Zymomonas mobilis]
MHYNHLIQKSAFSFSCYSLSWRIRRFCSDLFSLKIVKTLCAFAQEVHHEQNLGIFKNAYS